MQDTGRRTQDAEVTKLLSVFTLHVCTLLILSGSHGVPDVNLFQFLSFAWSVIGFSSSGNKQTLATCTSLLGALHMDIVHVANIKTTKGDVT